MGLQDDIIKAMESLDEKNNGVHVNKIVSHLRISAQYGEMDEEKLKSDVNRVLRSGVVRKQNKVFKKVEGKKKGSFRKGIYRRVVEPKAPNIIRVTQPSKPEEPTLFGNKDIKKPKKGKQPAIKETSKISKTHLGKGGEFAVMSELLYRGYFANSATVDDGVDIIAWKDDAFFLIQVKTTTIEEGLFKYTIKQDSFERYDSKNMYYIFVMRVKEDVKLDKFVNWYIVLPASTVQLFIDSKYISTNSDSYSIKFENRGRGVYIRNGVLEYDVADTNLNRFDLIKK